MAKEKARQIKVPKGTRDCAGRGQLLRESIFDAMTTIFQRQGGIPLDTPVFELSDILSEKYGEDSRLIYDLEDQGGEACSLRYDLTVPFARWLAMNTDVKKIKRYQIAKVYRRDQPAITRGRFREFYQCDFDIAGVYDPMIPDAEIIRIVSDVFKALDLKVQVKMNNRKILDGIFAAAGVPSELIRPISSAVDKLDKMSWGDVKKEMVQKGLSEAVADTIGEYVRRSGSLQDMLAYLQGDPALAGQAVLQEGLRDMELLAVYLSAMKVVDLVSFDLSLARGLDYYTGLIYEVVSEEDSKVGSIAAGGRYDNLVGMYGKEPVPCVGVSFGVERIYTLLDARRTEDDKKNNLRRALDVYIMAIGKEPDGLLPERMAIACELWDVGLSAEYTAKVKARQQQQIDAAKQALVTVILRKDELDEGKVRIKAVQAQAQVQTQTEKGAEKDRDLLVDRKDVVEEVKKLVAVARRKQTKSRIPIRSRPTSSNGSQ